MFYLSVFFIVQVWTDYSSSIRKAKRFSHILESNSDQMAKIYDPFSCFLFVFCLFQFELKVQSQIDWHLRRENVHFSRKLTWKLKGKMATSTISAWANRKTHWYWRFLIFVFLQISEWLICELICIMKRWKKSFNGKNKCWIVQIFADFWYFTCLTPHQCSHVLTHIGIYAESRALMLSNQQTIDFYQPVLFKNMFAQVCHKSIYARVDFTLPLMRWSIFCALYKLLKYQN